MVVLFSWLFFLLDMVLVVSGGFCFAFVGLFCAVWLCAVWLYLLDGLTVVVLVMVIWCWWVVLLLGFFGVL